MDKTANMVYRRCREERHTECPGVLMNTPETGDRLLCPCACHKIEVMSLWAVEIVDREKKGARKVRHGFTVLAATGDEARGIAIFEHTRGLGSQMDLIISTKAEPEGGNVVKTYSRRV
jgi:hypothetical protein